MDLEYYKMYCKKKQTTATSKRKRNDSADINRDSISAIMRIHGVFHWKIEFPLIFKNNNGFDIILGNPPYIRQEHLDSMIGDTRYKNILINYYATFFHDSDKLEAGMTADLSTYFILRSIELLHEGGIQCYLITSKWIKTAYGKPVRDYIARNTQVLTIADFSKVSLFSTASIDVIVYFLRKIALNAIDSKDQRPFEYIEVGRDHFNAFEGSSERLSYEPFRYFESVILEFSKDARFIPNARLLNNAWIFVPDDLLTIRSWIEQNGTPIRQMKGIEINSGIKTGFNEAFVIPQEIKEKIDPSERFSNIIKPVLKGKEIRKYNLTKNLFYLIYFPFGFTNSWITMNTKNEPSEKPLLLKNNDKKDPLVPFFEEFKPIFDHLHQFCEDQVRNAFEPEKKTAKRMKKGLVERDDQGQYWWELRACAYYDKFTDPKIVWQEISQDSQFYWDVDGHFLLNTAYMLNNCKKSWTAILNSSLIHWYFSYLSPKLGENGHRYTKQYVEQIPLISTDQNQDRIFEWCIDTLQSAYLKLGNKDFIDLILTITDAMVYELYFHSMLYSLKYYEKDGCHILSRISLLLDSQSLNSKDIPEIYKILNDDSEIKQFIKSIKLFRNDKLKME